VTPPRWPDLGAWPIAAFARGILAMDGRPVPLAPGEIDRLRADDGALVPHAGSVPVHRAFTPGQSVRVLAGPFREFVAELDAIDRAGARITVQLFGRPTPVPLPLTWLEAA
jgi:transcription antitermination factor NusG